MRGSQPGERRGGRQKGTPNRATAARQAEIEASGLTPLDFMLSVMRDEKNDLDDRLDAAKAAAPFVHPKLSAMEIHADVETVYQVSDKPLTDEEWIALHGLHEEVVQ